MRGRTRIETALSAGVRSPGDEDRGGGEMGCARIDRVNAWDLSLSDSTSAARARKYSLPAGELVDQGVGGLVSRRMPP